MGRPYGHVFRFAIATFGATLLGHLAINVASGIMAIYELTAINVEKLEGLVEVGFGEFGLQEFGDLGEVERLAWAFG